MQTCNAELQTYPPCCDENCLSLHSVHLLLSRQGYWLCGRLCWCDLCISQDSIHLYQVVLIRVCLSFENCTQILVSRCIPNFPERRFIPFSLSNLISLNLFFGNMPLTALRKTSPPPHFLIIPSMFNSFRLPGRVVWR
jgi:hypothetical protein